MAWDLVMTEGRRVNRTVRVRLWKMRPELPVATRCPPAHALLGPKACTGYGRKVETTPTSAQEVLTRYDWRTKSGSCGKDRKSHWQETATCPQKACGGKVQPWKFAFNRRCIRPLNIPGHRVPRLGSLMRPVSARRYPSPLERHAIPGSANNIQPTAQTRAV